MGMKRDYTEEDIVQFLKEEFERILPPMTEIGWLTEKKRLEVSSS